MFFRSKNCVSEKCEKEFFSENKKKKQKLIKKKGLIIKGVFACVFRFVTITGSGGMNFDCVPGHGFLNISQSAKFMIFFFFVKEQLCK